MKRVSVLSGIFFLTISNIIVKFIGIISQLVLATLISRNDFELFALSTSITAIVLGLTNGGSDNLLVQRGRKFNFFASYIFSYSIMFNLLAFFLLAILSIFAPKYYNNSGLTPIILFNGLGIIMATLVPITGAKLAIDSRYNDIARINLIALSTKHLTTIAFAFLGFGVYAFVIPILLQYTYATYLSVNATGYLPKFKSLKKKYFFSIVNSTKWIMAGNFCFQLSNNGQLFILGTFGNSGDLGIFFFCLMLINSPVALINGAVSSVIFPKLSNLNRQPAQFKESLLKAMKIGYSLNVLASLVAYIAIPIFIQLLWPHKWGDAIPIVKLLMFIIPSLTLIELMNYTLASKGLWKIRFYMLGAFVAVEAICLSFLILFYDLPTTCFWILILKSIFMCSAIQVVFNRCQIESKLFQVFLFVYVLPITIISLVLTLDEISIYEPFGPISVLLIGIVYYTYLSRFFLLTIMTNILVKMKLK